MTTCRSDMGNLREYQNQLISDVSQAWHSGYTSPCIVLPCGGGKSVIVAEIAKRTTDNKKHVLFLVHRKELCDQIENTFKWWGVDMNYCTVGMVQTISRRLNKIQQPALIITDENHHSKANTYKKIYEHFNACYRVGVTATPVRLDGSGLIGVNDKLIIGVSAKWLIENNYLSNYDYYAPVIKMPKIHTLGGDFVQSEVAEFFKKSKIYGDVINHYKKLADGKQAICYCPTIEFSKSITEQFNSNNISAAHLDGETPKNERTQIVEDFKSGKIKILCNVDLISEGFDVPDCECAILLRPTKSLTLYIQQSMRCMRYKENKRAIIIDHVDNVRRFGFPDDNREWALEGKPRKKGQSAMCESLKICRNCFAAVPVQTVECPHCGYKFSDGGRTPEQIKEVRLEKITEIVKAYISPADCSSFEQLQIYAKQHGYKPGWAYYQAKKRGLLYGNKNRNANTKHYPCRAIKSWDSAS